MLAMQYSFTLPADYDMGIIRRRIETKGHLMDGFPGLCFKAFCYAVRSDHGYSRENLYAPIYLWNDPAGLSAFLSGPGFAALTQAFGRPRVAIWQVIDANLTEAIASAGSATRETVPIAPQTQLEALFREERDANCDSIENDGALAAVAAYEPGSWTLARIRLFEGEPAKRAGAGQAYTVGHMSLAG